MPYPYDDPELEELAALFDEEGDPSFMDRLGSAFAANPTPMPQANPYTSPFAGFLMGLGSGASNAIGSGYQRKQAQKEKSASTRLALARFGLEKRKGEMAENERRAKEKAAADAEAKRAEAERVKAAEMDPNTPEGQARIDREAGYEAALDKRRTQLGLPSKFKPERAEPKLPPGAISKEQGTALTGLRDDMRLDPDISGFVTVRDNYARMKSMVEQKTGIGDLSIIFAFMKVLDPTSVVREQEYKNAAEAIGKIPALRTRVEKGWLEGDKLTDQGRAGFLRAAEELYRAKEKNYDEAIRFYDKQAEAYQIPREYLRRDMKIGGVAQDTTRSAIDRTKSKLRSAGVLK